MKYYADLHIHSPFSRATSKHSDLPGLLAWALVKGIHLVGTGDFTHPAWFSRLREQLAEAEPGFFRLKGGGVPPAFPGASPEGIDVRFVLTAEISSIYKRHGKVRKVHNVLVVPSFDDASRIGARLAAIGNIESDGRPILGLDSRDLLEIFLEESPNGFFVPAHIWTPWFSLFGSKSGFDTIEDCFGDLTGHIFALETGLSSDPDMNRMVSALDRFALISNSDCHSPAKLGREQNIFDTAFDFPAMREALEHPEDGGFLGTVEFYPEEGKYHFDGHRKCGVRLDPMAARALDAVCPECGRGLTIGVSHRVLELADRDRPVYQRQHPGFTSLVPLPEVLGEIMGRGPATKGVMALYAKVVNRFGSENNFYHNTPLEEIGAFSPVLAEAVRRVRENQVIKSAGFDGEFGVIRVFEEGELDGVRGQASLFGGRKRAARKKKTAASATLFSPAPADAGGSQRQPAEKRSSPSSLLLERLNPDQRRAVMAESSIVAVTAGPGTGKTHTLATRIGRLLAQNVPASSITAITFTNKAADELRERLAPLVPEGERLFTGTFHAFCLEILRRGNPGLLVAGNDERRLLLARLFPEISRKETEALLSSLDQGPSHSPADAARKAAYLACLEENGLIDMDGIVPAAVDLLKRDHGIRAWAAARCRHLFVDEFQDVNQAQYELCRLLARHGDIFAIGDPDQAIYGFRGSDPAFFLRLRRGDGFAGKDVTAVSLVDNYRSAPEIIEAAAALIARNSDHGRAPLRALNASPGLIERHQAPTPEAEAEFVVSRIEAVMGGVSSFSMDSGRSEGDGAGRSFHDIAVCCRLRAQCETIGAALARRGIPCRLVGVPPFYMSPSLRPAAHLLLAAAGLASPAQTISLCAALPGVGEATRRRLEAIPLQSEDIMAEALAMNAVPAGAKTAIRSLAAMVERLRRMTDNRQRAARALEYLGISGGESGRLVELATLFGGNLDAFGRHLRDNADGAAYDERAEAVAVLTLHAAKGLEFPVVFICGLEEGLLPRSGPDGTADIEEERRLFFVGLTRAKEHLILCHAKKRVVHGRVNEQRPSRFLAELPKRLVRPAAPAPTASGRGGKPAARQLSLF